MEIEDEESKQSLYSGSYDENLDKFLSLFERRAADLPQRASRLPNPMTWNPYYLVKRKGEHSGVLSSGRKKVKSSGGGNGLRPKARDSKAVRSDFCGEFRGK